MTETTNIPPETDPTDADGPDAQSPVAVDAIAFVSRTSHEVTDEGRGFLTLGAVGLLLLVITMPPMSAFQVFLVVAGVVMPSVLIWRLLANPETTTVGTTDGSHDTNPDHHDHLTAALADHHPDRVTVSGSVKQLFRRIEYEYTVVPRNLHRIQPVDGVHAPRALAALITGLPVFLLGVLIDLVILLIGAAILVYAVAISLHKAPAVIDHSSTLASIIRVGIPVVLGIELLTLTLFLTGAIQVPLPSLEGGITSTVILVLFSIVVELELPRDGIKLTRPDGPTDWLDMTPTDAHSLYYEVMNTNPDATPAA